MRARKNYATVEIHPYLHLVLVTVGSIFLVDLV